MISKSTQAFWSILSIVLFVCLFVFVWNVLLTVRHLIWYLEYKHITVTCNLSGLNHIWTRIIYMRRFKSKHVLLTVVRCPLGWRCLSSCVLPRWPYGRSLWVDSGLALATWIKAKGSWPPSQTASRTSSETEPGGDGSTQTNKIIKPQRLSKNNDLSFPQQPVNPDG